LITCTSNISNCLASPPESDHIAGMLEELGIEDFTVLLASLGGPPEVIARGEVACISYLKEMGSGWIYAKLVSAFGYYAYRAGRIKHPLMCFLYPEYARAWERDNPGWELRKC